MKYHGLFVIFEKAANLKLLSAANCRWRFKETGSVTMNIFQKKKILFKSFVKIELSYVFTINMFSTAESCMEQ